jgi:hypothetical protein
MGLYFARRQVLSGAELGVRASGWHDSSIYLSWGHELQNDFAMKSGLPGIATVRIFFRRSTNSRKVRTTLASQTVAP